MGINNLLRVGVLGGFGFVGKNLVNYLSNLGINVCCASRKNGVDATNPVSLDNWLTNTRMTCLVNLAAECGGIGLNAKRPADLWHSVTAISHNVLEAARRHRLNKLIMVGTVCSYAKDCPVPFKEDDLMHHGCPEPTNLAYGVAKLASLFGAQAYCKQYGMDIVNLVPVNMYGPHDHFDLQTSHVIPAIIKKIDDAIKERRDNITLWGTGSATREFLYVEDFCYAVQLAITKDGVPPNFINVGTGAEISIRDLATTICEAMGFQGEIKWDAHYPDGQPRRCLDIARAKSMLGYAPKVSLKDGIRQTLDWYKETFYHQWATLDSK